MFHLLVEWDKPICEETMISPSYLVQKMMQTEIDRDLKEMSLLEIGKTFYCSEKCTLKSVYLLKGERKMVMYFHPLKADEELFSWV